MLNRLQIDIVTCENSDVSADNNTVTNSRYAYVFASFIGSSKSWSGFGLPLWDVKGGGGEEEHSQQKTDLWLYLRAE